MTGDLILDTSAVVAHLRGVAAVTARLQTRLRAQDTLYLPLTAWGELLFGAYHAGEPARELANLNEYARVRPGFSVHDQGLGISSWRQRARTVPSLISRCRGRGATFPVAGFFQRLCAPPSRANKQPCSRRCRSTSNSFMTRPA